MSIIRLAILSLIIFTSYTSAAQADSVLQVIAQVPKKYLTEIDKKIDKYQHRITNKTEKTLTRLARWENKIKSLLEKASRETAQRLFGEGKTTFTTLLQQLKNGEQIVNTQRARYDEYRDKLSTSIQYLTSSISSKGGGNGEELSEESSGNTTQLSKTSSISSKGGGNGEELSEDRQAKHLNPKLLNPKRLNPKRLNPKLLNQTNKKLNELETEVQQQEAIAAFIKERKKQLVEEALKHIGNSKYLTKISKESYYYIETIKNYKEIFSDKKKAEATALTILNKIPAFKKFVQENSMLAKLFGSPNATPNMQSLAGLQTRASVNALIQNQIAAGGPNAQEQIRQNIQEAQAQLNQLKDKVLKAGGNSSDDLTPDPSPGGEGSWKPNTQKSKTFKQRIELNPNIQMMKGNGLIPNATNIGLNVGYKLINDKIVVGIGAGYKMGIGSIQKIRFTSEGINLRSFIEWKLKYQFYISGGYEMNYNASFKNVEQLKNYQDWTPSGLVGISKKIAFSSPTGGVRGGLTKLTKGTKLQLLYDVLANRQVPKTQQWVFRMGYQF